MTTRQALWAVIAISTAFRLLFASSVGGYTNEAYYFTYARHLDWGFFDHPPMVGAVAAIGPAVLPSVSPELGLRFGFVLLFAASSWLLARLTARLYGPRAGVLAALALNGTIFYGLKIGTFADPDGPLLFFWLLTLDRLLVAFEEPERVVPWIGVGLAWGGALLSKYHAVFLPAGAVLYLLLRPANRRCLRTPGPYLAAVVGGLMFSPVIFWNSHHGWASFLYQGNRAGGFHGFRPEMLQEALVGQALYLTPWIWVWLLVVLFRMLRRGLRDWSEAEALLMCEAIPALTLFMGLSTFQRIMAHWPLIGFVALLPLLGRTWANLDEKDGPRFRRRLVAVAIVPMVLGCLFIVQARTGLFQDGKGRLLGLIPSRRDPTVDTIRWRQIAHELEQRGLLDEPGTFLFTDYWCFSAELEMATKRPSPVACFHRDARSFTFWSRPEEWVGRDGIFVRVEDGLCHSDFYEPWFTRVEPIGSFPIVRAGVPLQTVKLYRCVRQTDPFPIGYRGPGLIPRPKRATEPDSRVMARSGSEATTK